MYLYVCMSPHVYDTMSTTVHACLYKTMSVNTPSPKYYTVLLTIGLLIIAIYNMIIMMSVNTPIYIREYIFMSLLRTGRRKELRRLVVSRSNAIPGRGG